MHLTVYSTGLIMRTVMRQFKANAISRLLQEVQHSYSYLLLLTLITKHYSQTDDEYSSGSTSACIHFTRLRAMNIVCMFCMHVCMTVYTRYPVYHPPFRPLFPEWGIALTGLSSSVSLGRPAGIWVHTSVHMQPVKSYWCVKVLCWIIILILLCVLNVYGDITFFR